MYIGGCITHIFLTTETLAFSQVITHSFYLDNSEFLVNWIKERYFKVSTMKKNVQYTFHKDVPGLHRKFY